MFVLQKAASRTGGADDGWAYLVDMLRSPLLWVAIAMTPIQLWLWTVTLRRTDLGWAYPVTALAYPLTMIVALLAFGESYNWHVWLGAILITAGAAVLGPPERTHTPARV